MEIIYIDKFPPNTSILLKEDFLKELRSRISSEEKLILKQNTNGFRNLGKILPICSKYGVSVLDLTKSILAYRTALGRITVNNPKLPVTITPIFDMLIAHAIGDGFCSHLINRMPAFVYRQSRNEILDLFLKKMESVFGNIMYKDRYFYNQKHIYMSSVLSYVLYSHYSLEPEDFLESSSRIPKSMLNKNEDHLTAVLIAFILDEGHIDSSNIVIGLHNKNLLHDIKTICDKLGYKNILRHSKSQNHLYILSEGVQKFWIDYNKLKARYPEVSLDYKEKLIENFILRKQKLWKSAQQGETQNKIIELLKEYDKTVKELSIILQISRQGIKWHLAQFEKSGTVKKIGKGYANSDIYKLINYVVLPTKRKGRSRQYGITNVEIINMLKRGTMTTKEISEKIQINRATTFHFMLNLEKEGKIKKIGKRVHKTHPSTLWSIV